MQKAAKAKTALNGKITVPGDKSISHRAIMFGSVATGTTTVEGLLTGDDCLRTIDCFRKLGVEIEQEGTRAVIEGKGFEGLTEPAEPLDVGNSGTTIRLMLGILANTPFETVIAGDDSIARRPMDRVTEPLKMMGASIGGRENGKYAPINIKGGGTEGIAYRSPVASAQVKSAVLLAGLTAAGETSVTEPETSRDHTERMLREFGCDVQVEGRTSTVIGGQPLQGTDIRVPGDISSAAFFLAAGAILPGSEIRIENVGVNPTRTGVIDVLRNMGADLTVTGVRNEDGEPAADLLIRYSELRGTEIGGDIIPRLIDEIPILALTATQADGVTIIKDAAELKVKETNRIDTVVNELRKMGASIEATEDGMKITGGTPLKGAEVDSHGDHRIGMMLAIAALLAEGETKILNKEAINISFPGFFETIGKLAAAE